MSLNWRQEEEQDILIGYFHHVASRGVDSAVSAVPAPYDLRVGGQHIMSTQRKEGPSLTHSESQKGWPWVGSAAQVRSWLQWKHMMAWPTDMCT